MTTVAFPLSAGKIAREASAHITQIATHSFAANYSQVGVLLIKPSWSHHVVQAAELPVLLDINSQKVMCTYYRRTSHISNIFSVQGVTRGR